MKKIDSIILSGKESLPLIEGGKGIAISSGESSGAWAKAGGVGTFSGVNADSNFSYNKDDISDMFGQEIEVFMASIGQPLIEYLVNFEFFILKYLDNSYTSNNKLASKAK